jgi:hypothetical protein
MYLIEKTMQVKGGKVKKSSSATHDVFDNNALKSGSAIARGSYLIENKRRSVLASKRKLGEATMCCKGKELAAFKGWQVVWKSAHARLAVASTLAHDSGMAARGRVTADVTWAVHYSYSDVRR